MSKIAQYVLCITSVGILCGIINGLFRKESAYGYFVKLLTAVFMLITLISPFIKIRIDDMSIFFNEIQSEGEQYRIEGEKQAQRAKQEIIKAQTEAYILDKADSLGTEVTAEVQFDEEQPYIPYQVILRGAVSPYCKKVLGDYMTHTLGIPKENQRWT